MKIKTFVCVFGCNSEVSEDEPFCRVCGEYGFDEKEFVLEDEDLKFKPREENL